MVAQCLPSAPFSKRLGGKRCGRGRVAGRESDSERTVGVEADSKKESAKRIRRNDGPERRQDRGVTDSRTLPRNVLAQDFPNAEKAALEAAATNTGLDAALAAVGFTDDASDDEDYLSKAKAPLDRCNVGNAAMTGAHPLPRRRPCYATHSPDSGAMASEDASIAVANADMAATTS